MNILIADSWLREYLKTKAAPKKIAQCLSLCGASVERLNKIGNDWVYDIEITSNRVDMASVVGIAREAAAILPQFGIKATFKPNIPPSIKRTSSHNLTITIKDPPKVCRRVLGVILDNVKLGLSPKIISQRLNAAGIRSLNNVVDVTNYVMTEIGHPTHVFDYDRLVSKKLILRYSKPGEEIISLEDKKYKLVGGDIVIDDGSGKIIDLPGIIGTANSVVVENTKRILFFIEANNPTKIRKTSMTLGIRTVAASLNEKNVDPNLAEIALRRGVQLFTKLTGAKVASRVYDIYPHSVKTKTVKISLQSIKQYLGIPIQLTKVVKILQLLGFKTQLTTHNSQLITITVPTWRVHDVSIPQDIIEEVARIYGYHNLPSVLPSGQLPIRPTNQTYSQESLVKNSLVDWGFTETYTYSMQSLSQLQKCQLEPQDYLKIVNPLTEEWVYMRRRLLPSLLTVLEQNQSPEGKDIRIFELSKIYLKQDADLPQELLWLTVLQNKDNFYQIKGIMEAIFTKLNIAKYDLKLGTNDSLFNNDKSVTIFIENKLVGYLGQVKPAIVNNFNLSRPITVLDIDFRILCQFASIGKKFEPLPAFPPIIEDLTFKFTNPLFYTKVISLIKQTSKLIKRVELADQYENRKTFRIYYQVPEKSLTGNDITKIRIALVRNLEKEGLTLVGQI